MSRSYRNKNIKDAVIHKMGGDSNKKDKRIANRKFRRLNNMNAKKSVLTEDDEFEAHNLKDVSNTYEFSSDGLAYYWDLKKYNKSEKNRIKSK